MPYNCMGIIDDYTEINKNEINDLIKIPKE